MKYLGLEGGEGVSFMERGDCDDGECRSSNGCGL
jgi:hypothetical protein